MKTLVIDVGGTNLKIGASARQGIIKIPSGPELTAAEMAAHVRADTSTWTFDNVTIGFPGPVANNRPLAEPVNLGKGWRRFNYARAFGVPVRIINDAAMQALGSYRGGRMLFLGLGTGMGSALVVNGEVAPLELAHLPYRKNRTYEEYAGKQGRKRLGVKRWRKHVLRIIALLAHGLQAEDVVIGGGEARQLPRLPRGVRRVSNDSAIVGGIRLWSGRGSQLSPSARGRK
ncbi:MAG: ROK family protein [Acidobacteriota bacterium]